MFLIFANSLFYFIYLFLGVHYILWLIIAVFLDFTVQILWGVGFFFFSVLSYSGLFLLCLMIFLKNCEPVFFKILSVRFLCGLDLNYVLP